MRRFNATLPALGMVAIDFHKESELAFGLYDEGELVRLRSVPHLGVASAVFTGVNHSRLEYALLQCAVISLVAKLHKQNARFALSNKVSIPGLDEDISSGEELLKVWALLGNYGHMQYTYGVERGLLQAAYRNPDLKNWLSSCSRDSGLNRWSKDVIENYQDSNFHYLCALLRISNLPRGDRRKKLFKLCLRSLVLPPEDLFSNGSAQRDKLVRLRQLFSRIRLLTMVAIDSHYSHAPVSLNLSSAILGLVNFTPSPQGNGGGFDSVISQTAGMLADELYLHPASVACQRDYELRIANSIKRRLPVVWSESAAERIFKELVSKGVGSPSTAKLRPLVRFSFRRIRRQFLGSSGNLYDSICHLEHELTSNPKIKVSIDQNSFTGSTHVDVLYVPESVSLAEVALTYYRFGNWLLRTLEADALISIRGIYPTRSRGDRKKILPDLRKRYVERRYREHASLMQTLFLSVINFLVPKNHSVVWPDLLPGPSNRAQVLYRVRDSEQNLYDQISPSLELQLNENPRNYSAERLHEISCLRDLIGASPSAFVLASMERFQICEESGRPVDDWDGTILEFYDDRILLKIIEAKAGGNATQRESEAVKQLRATRILMLQENALIYRTRRIKAKGAYIEFVVPTK